MEGASRQSLAAVRRGSTTCCARPVDPTPLLLRAGLPGCVQLAPVRPAQLTRAVRRCRSAARGGRPAPRAGRPGDGRAGADRAGRARASGKASDETLEILRWAVERRWSVGGTSRRPSRRWASRRSSRRPRHRVSSRMSRIELFGFGRIAEGNAELSLALSPAVPVGRKRGLLERLLIDGRSR